MQKNVFLGLGSNLGEREAFLENAIARLDEHPEINVIARSTMMQTEPVGNVSQPMFLNMAIEIETSLCPDKLLALCLSIEIANGRERTEKWGARTLDIDILFYGDVLIEKEGITIPHPEAHERFFVLAPLAEIAGEFHHPRLKESISAILQHI